MPMHDLLIVGGGPAGLSAALNGAAEGLDVALLERDERLGGQAGTSSRIENYLGFADGISGHELTERTIAQAERLGANLHTECEVKDLRFNAATGLWVAECRGNKFVAPTIVAAVGVDYRRLPIPGGDCEFVHYGARPDMHARHSGKNVLVVGGGNSAGQAVLSLAHHGANITLLVRRPLGESMSRYLIERIAKNDRIDARLGEVTAIDEAEGCAVINCNDCVDDPNSPFKEKRIPTDACFAYIGSEPRTDFLKGCCATDDYGFIKADHDFKAHPDGLIVAGDVRSGSAKRVAVASGEGAIGAAAAWRHVNGVKL